MIWGEGGGEGMMGEEVRERGRGWSTSRYILLIRKDKQQGLFHLPVQNYAMEFLPRFVYSCAVVGVDDEDQSLGA